MRIVNSKCCAPASTGWKRSPCLSESQSSELVRSVCDKPFRPRFRKKANPQLVGIFAREEHIVSDIPGEASPPNQVLTNAARSRSFRTSSAQSHLFPLIQICFKSCCPYLRRWHILGRFGPRKGLPRSPCTIRYPCRDNRVRQLELPKMLVVMYCQ